MLYSQCTQAAARDTAELAYRYITIRKSTLHFWDRFVHFFLLPIKLLLLLNLLICTAWSLFSPLVLLAPHLSSPFLDHLHLLL